MSSAAIDAELLKQAADWALMFQYDNASESQYQAFERWRQQSPAHAAAWDRAQAVFDTFEHVPPAISKTAIKSLEQGQDRRRVLRLLSLALLLPGGWLAWRGLPWPRWTADVATATGELKTIRLPDGSQLTLNTGTAADLAFDGRQRRIRLLAGEILITTQIDSAPKPRPFLVDTAYGSLRALGTRFSVRDLGQGKARVTVLESAVEIRPLNGPKRILHAGQQADFGVFHIEPSVGIDNSVALWQQGRLLAKDMRLADVLAELGRYRFGLLRCDPAVADLLVSGAISLADTDASLALLEKSLPIRISRLSAYWVSVGPVD